MSTAAGSMAASRAAVVWARTVCRPQRAAAAFPAAGAAQHLPRHAAAAVACRPARRFCSPAVAAGIAAAATRAPQQPPALGTAASRTSAAAAAPRPMPAHWAVEPVLPFHEQRRGLATSSAAAPNSRSGGPARWPTWLGLGLGAAAGAALLQSCDPDAGSIFGLRTAHSAAASGARQAVPSPTVDISRQMLPVRTQCCCSQSFFLFFFLSCCPHAATRSAIFTGGFHV